jgi:hypothetical protein
MTYVVRTPDFPARDQAATEAAHTSQGRNVLENAGPARRVNAKAKKARRWAKALAVGLMTMDDFV